MTEIIISALILGSALYLPRLMTKVFGGFGLLVSCGAFVVIMIWVLAEPYVPSQGLLATDDPGLAVLADMIVDAGFAIIYGGLAAVAFSRNVRRLRTGQVTLTSRRTP